jgi:signal transduction histidine kinase
VDLRMAGADRGDAERSDGAGPGAGAVDGAGAVGAARTQSNTTVLGDRLALRRVVANLVDNALHYGKAAHLSVDASSEFVTLLVDDEGSGIPVDQREQILEPFVRLEDSRNRRTGGAGLGLAVARSLVEAHEGVISIDDAPGGGARLMVRLPLFVAR